MKYTILADISKSGLIKTVNKYIADGWIPIGGVCKDKIMLVQAMTMDERSIQ